MEFLADQENKLQLQTVDVATTTTTVVTTDFGYIDGVLVSWASKPTTTGNLEGKRNVSDVTKFDVTNDGGSGNGTALCLVWGK